VSPVRILLARHGQAAWQLTRSGDLDSPLTPAGHRQAAALAGRLAEQTEGIAAVRVSPMVRARQTADHLCAALGLPAVVLDTLAEAPFRVVGELASPRGPLDATPEHGGAAPTPRYQAFREQVASALGELYELGPALPSGACVLAVTHGGVIKTLLRILAGSDLVDFEVSNASVTCVQWRHGRWRVDAVNRYDHLSADLLTS
jgi:broad specificity phosphatase PhoE